MNGKSDRELLQAYALEKSEAAFTELVRRHVHLVYSAALRLVLDPHLAQDVAQATFVALAQNAGRLASREVLSSWLHLTTRNLAAKLVRSEERRRSREKEAMAIESTAPESEQIWIRLAPLLDEAVACLNDNDRDALMLRFFERKSAGEMGQALAITEEAAQKRVSRAVGRLREFFSKRGITVTVSGLAAVLSANAVQPAPAGLGSALATGALTGSALSIANLTAAKAIAMTTIQKAVVAVSLVAAVATAIYEAREASLLRTQLQTFQQEQSPLTEQVAQLKAENESLSNRLLSAKSASSLSTERLRELLRLRGEVGVLRRRQGELEQLVAGAQSKAAQTGRQSLASKPGAPPPFQVRAVLDEPGDDAETMTNSASRTSGETLYVQKAPLLEQTAIRSVTARRNASSGAPEIEVEFSDEGKELFAAVTKENINKRLAIVLNGQVYSAPVIRSEISGGKATITGNFTEEEAKELAARISEAIRGQ